jgi:lipopolysaccharide transport system ATP-binding protein
MSSENAVEVTGLSKCYQIYSQPTDRLKQMIFQGRRQYFKEFWALRDVSFEIKKGETVGIIGRNGSGKSTLLQLLCGTLNPTSGNIKVKGRVAALLELGAGFNPEFSGRENVYMNAALLGLTQEQTHARLDQILAFADIGDFIDQPVKTYSSGMFVRLAFAVIAHVDADILVIDEALAVGDVFFTQKCMLFLRKFQEKGTVIFVTHDTSSVLALCNRGIWLNKGHLMACSDAKSVCEAYLNDYYDLNRETQIQGDPDLSKAKHTPVQDFADCRKALIETSTLRTDLECTIFDAIAETTAVSGQVKVTDVHFVDMQSQAIKWFNGGELVNLQIVFENQIDLHRPIVGFLVKDKLGQALFGDNTFITYADKAYTLKTNQTCKASFTFRMPVMPAGDYTLGVAVASGTQEEHLMHTWVHDALVIKSHSKNVATGLLGIPMLSIEIDAYEN